MNITEEMLSKAKTATSAAELQAMAKEFSIELTDTEAADYFDFLNDNRKFSEDGLPELSSAELTMVAGGKGEPTRPDPKYKVGQTLWVGYPSTWNYLRVTILQIEFWNYTYKAWRYLVLNEYGIEESYYLDDKEYIRTTAPHGQFP